MAFQVVLEFIRLDMIEMYFVRFLIQQILLALSPFQVQHVLWLLLSLFQGDYFGIIYV